MNVKIYKNPCLLLEAVELVYAFVNKIPISILTAQGDYCIPEQDMRNIMDKACEGLSLEDEVLSFYFKAHSFETETDRRPCLACALVYSSLHLGFSDIDTHLEELSKYWRGHRNKYKINGIDGFSLDFADERSEEEVWLFKEMEKLPVSQNYKAQLLEVFSGFDYHLKQLGSILRPVAKKLEVLLAPYVERATPLIDQWESFFNQWSVEEFILKRARMKYDYQYQSIEIALRYVFPCLAPGKTIKEEGRLVLHIGVGMAVSLQQPEAPSEAIGDWEFNALKLLANQTRSEMLRVMMGRSMTVQEIATALNLNAGSVFRDINSLCNARLLVTEAINGRNYYKTNYTAIQVILKHFQEYYESGGSEA